MNYSENTAVMINHFFFMFLRISAIFTVSPVFGRRNVPSAAKIGLSLLLTGILITVYPLVEGNENINLIEFFMICLNQLIIGLMMGIVTTCFFATAAVAGQIIDIQIGFSAASAFDPQYSTQISITGNLLNNIVLICFFLANGHHMLIRLIGESFRLIPVGAFSIKPQTAIIFTEIFIKTFIISIQMAMPVIAASLLSEVIMGVLMRLVPQLNFFVVGFPIKIGLGLLVLLTMIPVFVNSCSGLFDNMFNAVERIFEGMVT